MMHYSFPAIQALSEDLKGLGAALLEQTNVLDDAVKRLVSEGGSFAGGSSDAYTQAIGKWRGEIGDTQEILNSIAGHVSAAGHRMEAQDKAGAKSLLG